MRDDQFRQTVDILISSVKIKDKWNTCDITFTTNIKVLDVLWYFISMSHSIETKT